MPVFNAVLLRHPALPVPPGAPHHPDLGLVGAPLLFAAFVADLFGAFDQVSAPRFVLTLPLAAWELSVGIWMTFKGFRPEAVAALEARSDA